MYMYVCTDRYMYRYMYVKAVSGGGPNTLLT